MNQPLRDRRRKRSPFKRIGVYVPVLGFVGFVFSLMIYLAVMDVLGWRVPVIGDPTRPTDGVATDDNAGGRGLLGSTRVLLYASPHSVAYFKTIGGNYDNLLAPWREYFASRPSMSYKLINQPFELEGVNGGVLVLPSAAALSQQERQQIGAYRARGGAVLATWATGTRDDKGQWQGWGFLEDLAGGKFQGETPVDDDHSYLVLSGQTPLLSSLPVGQRIEMTRTSEALLRLQATGVGAKFLPVTRLSRGVQTQEAAVSFNEISASAGRSAVFAFAETTWATHPFLIQKFFDDVLQWLARESAVVVAPWPQGKRAAHVLSMDVGESFGQAQAFAEMTRSQGLRPNFYVLASAAKSSPDVLARLQEAGELNHLGDVADSFKGQPIGLQEKRIRDMQYDMSTLTPQSAAMLGFKPPTDEGSPTLSRVLQKAGFKHQMTSLAESEARLPEWAKLEGLDRDQNILILPRTQRSDADFVQSGWSSEQIEQAWQADLTDVLAQGALGVLSLQSQHFSANGPVVRALPAQIERLKQARSQLWLTTPGLINAWWRDRERFKMTYANKGKRVEVNITVTGDKPLVGVGLVVTLPQKGAMPIVRSAKVGVVEPVVSKLDDYRASVMFDTLTPGNYSYQLTFTP